jgi:hypothetical protein
MDANDFRNLRSKESANRRQTGSEKLICPGSIMAATMIKKFEQHLRCDFKSNYVTY